MIKNKKIAVIGATGLVGYELVKLMYNDVNIYQNNKIVLFGSNKTKKRIIKLDSKHEYDILNIDQCDFSKFDIVFFMTSHSISKLYIPKALKSNCIVIDNSSAYRMDSSVPLIIPEININEIKTYNKLISNPNCSTIMLLMAIYPIYQISEIENVSVSTYQAVSGGGKKAIKDLINQTKLYLDKYDETNNIQFNNLEKNNVLNNNFFQHQTAFNLFSHDSQLNYPADEKTYNEEEEKIIKESYKILKTNINIFPTCIRVPILRTHSQSINITTKNELNIQKVQDTLSNFKGIKIVDDTKTNTFPMPINAEKENEVLVGRIRKNIFKKREIGLFITCDQLLKGAALNSLQIANKMKF